jgi:hypothetical protein
MKKLLMLSLLGFGLHFAAHAQTPADGGPAPTGPTPIPLDGGASLLLAAGAAYGLKRLRKNKRTPESR